MASTVNYALKYAKALAQVFTKASVVKPYTQNDMDFTGVKTVRVYKLNTVPENDYKRSGSNRYGEAQDITDTVMEYTMECDKSFTGIVDKGDEKDQTIENKAGQFLKAQLKQVTTPNADKYALRKIANFGHAVGIAAAPTKTTIVGLFADAMQYMDDHLVPEDGRVAFVPGTIYKLIATSDEFIKLEQLGVKSVSRGEVGELFGFKIVKVPTSYMPKGCYFMAMHKSCAAMPQKISETKIHKDPPGYSGALVEARQYFDVFVFGEKAEAVYVAAESGALLPTVTFGGTKDAVTLTSAGAAVIKYTLDGSDPRFSASAQIYGSAFKAETGDTVRAVGLAYAGWGNANKTDAGKFPADVAEKTY